MKVRKGSGSGWYNIINIIITFYDFDSGSSAPILPSKRYDMYSEERLIKLVERSWAKRPFSELFSHWVEGRAARAAEDYFHTGSKVKLPSR